MIIEIIEAECKTYISFQEDERTGGWPLPSYVAGHHIKTFSINGIAMIDGHCSEFSMDQQNEILDEKTKNVYLYFDKNKIEHLRRLKFSFDQCDFMLSNLKNGLRISTDESLEMHEMNIASIRFHNINDNQLRLHKMKYLAQKQQVEIN